MLSWFIENYNIYSHVLSIFEIQECLRATDFAHSNLIPGSHTWIGCVEASTVLSTVSEGRIACRILHAKCMQELESFFMTTVKEHLVVIGAPLMVGAGNYAYTIAGVDVEGRAVLVLDPHYREAAGGSDAEKAVAKGSIGWKRIDKFFDFGSSSSFINICLPYLD